MSSNRARGTTRTVYRCSATGVGHVARAADAVDDYVARLVIARLSEPDAIAVLRSDGASSDEQLSLRAEATALRARLEEAAASFADGAISASQLATITRRVKARLSDVEAALASSARSSALSVLVGKDVRRAWAALPIDRKRAIIKELLTVIVRPSGKRGNGFDPALIALDWHD